MPVKVTVTVQSGDYGYRWHPAPSVFNMAGPANGQRFDEFQERQEHLNRWPVASVIEEDNENP